MYCGDGYCNCEDEGEDQTLARLDDVATVGEADSEGSDLSQQPWPDDSGIKGLPKDHKHLEVVDLTREKYHRLALVSETSPSCCK